MADRADDLDRIEKGVTTTMEDGGEIMSKPSFDSSGPQSISVQKWIQTLWKSFLNLPFPQVEKAERLAPTRNPIFRKLIDCPRGYPRLAAFLDTDENFMLYRRFGFVQARLLLYKQDQLRELEGLLDSMDKIDEKNNEIWLHSRELNEDAEEDPGERKILMEKLELRFNEYVSLLTTARDLASFNRPYNREYIDVKRYFDKQNPLCYKEAYIYQKEDIVSLRPGREKAWLDAFVQSILSRLDGRSIRYMFSSEDWASKTDETTVQIFSRTRINNVVSVIITVLILALFIVPIYILWVLTQGSVTDARVALIIGLLLIFTLLFCCVLWLTTRAKRQEILAAAAAYCAVLVVFIGNVGKLSS